MLKFRYTKLFRMWKFKYEGYTISNDLEAKIIQKIQNLQNKKPELMQHCWLHFLDSIEDTKRREIQELMQHDLSKYNSY